MTEHDEAEQVAREWWNAHWTQSDGAAIASLAELLRSRERVLRIALDESVALQSHQAKLLNQYDGGERRSFENGDAWLARLIECGRFKKGY